MDGIRRLELMAGPQVGGALDDGGRNVADDEAPPFEERIISCRLALRWSLELV